LYDELVIQESQDRAPDVQTVAELLARKALEVGIERFVNAEALENFMARVDFAGLEQPDIPQAFSDLSAGLRSFAELKTAA
jgi:ATP-dependent helicase HrpB